MCKRLLQFGRIQTNLNSLNNWTMKSSMPFNIDKSYLLSMSNKPKQLCVGNKTIKVDARHFILGVKFSHDLNWILHINKVRTKAIGLFI